MRKYLERLNINSIAGKLSKYSQYSESVLVFCLKLWLSTILQCICMIVLSALFFDVSYFVAFFCVFFITRLMIEGYHCKTFLGCFILSNIIFILICVAANLTDTYYVLKQPAFFVELISTVYLLFVSIRNNLDKLHTKLREKIYFVLRPVWLTVVSGYIVFNTLANNFECSVYVWVMLYSYCFVFLLTIINERRMKNER
ncbi:MAG: accessory gene regulator B family protein [Lachnospirales bacterium]